MNYTGKDIFNYTNNLYWTNLPLDSYETAPSAGLVFVMADVDQVATVVPCSVLAHWIPSELSVYPKTDRNIHDTYSNPIEIVNRSNVDPSPSSQLTLSDEWWAMFNPDGTPMIDVLGGITGGPCAGCLHEYLAGSQDLAYRVSTIVDMLFPDALARSVPNTVHAVVQNSHNGSQLFAQDLDYFFNEHEEVPNGYSSWVDYVETSPDEWREAIVSVKKSWYAWSFNGVLPWLAAVALACQSILALAHVAIIVQGRWTSSAWGSLSDMIALALRSRSPAVPRDSWTGDEKKEIWSETVSVRVVEEELELMFNPLRAETLRLIQR